MGFDSNAKWIWVNKSPESNEYAYFAQKFNVDNTSNISLYIAAESDYIAYVNGKMVDFGQFAGFPNRKYYDTLDIGSFCCCGQNVLELAVRYEGKNTSCRIDSGAGVIFAVKQGDNTLAFSSSNTLGALHSSYVQHKVKSITVQLGLSSAMKYAEEMTLCPSVEVEMSYKLLPCPIKKCEHLAIEKGVRLDGTNIFDFGREITGFLRVGFKCKKETTVTVAYGEHIADSNVRRFIHDRDFSLDFTCKEGENYFEQYFVRLGMRYAEVLCDEDVEILSVELLPTLYPLTEKGTDLVGLDKTIYDVCVRTLRLSMNRHYEDCPWREQALYVLDSKNQMLCGYYAFKETEFPRAILEFISHGQRADGLLELTTPSKDGPSIPFFSVMYPVTVWEYVKYTNDVSLVEEIIDTLLDIMSKFVDRQASNGLIPNFPKPYWNFYEWSYGSDGGDSGDNVKFDLILNCAIVISAEKLKELCEMTGRKFELDTDKIKKAIVENFYNAENGLFHCSSLDKNLYTQLGNAFALLVGLGDERTVKAIKEDKTLVPATLSTAGFVYDALLNYSMDEANYILSDIREKYKYMLDCGATSFWETIEGEAAFGGAGSLCHGWSALPVYYYNILKDYI